MTDKNKASTDNKNSELEQERQIERLMKLAGEPPTPAADRKAQHKLLLQQTWQQSVKEQKRRRWMMAALPTGLAASLVLAVFILVNNLAVPTSLPIAEIVYRAGQVEVPSAQPTSESNLYVGDLLVTKADGVLTVKLSDETLVQLGASTELTLRAEGELWLHYGRVYVDSKDEQKNLLVQTAWGVLQDIGTIFEVTAGDNGLQLAMREGEVELTLNDQARQKTAATVNSGQGDVLTVARDFSVSRDVRPTNSSRWHWTHEGTPAFPQGRHRLANVLQWAARQSGRELLFQSDLVEMRVGNETVIWPAIEVAAIESRLHEISQTIDYQLEFTPENIFVLSKP